MSQAQNGKRSASSPSLSRLAAAKRAKHHAHKPCLKNNLAAYTSSQQPFLENPKKPFSEIPEIAG